MFLLFGVDAGIFSVQNKKSKTMYFRHSPNHVFWTTIFSFEKPSPILSHGSEGRGGFSFGSFSRVFFLPRFPPVLLQNLWRSTGERVVSASGAVYLFMRTDAVLDGQRNLLATPHWPSYERARLQASDFSARDYFGASVALSSSWPRPPIIPY